MIPTWPSLVRTDIDFLIIYKFSPINRFQCQGIIMRLLYESKSLNSWIFSWLLFLMREFCTDCHQLRKDATENSLVILKSLCFLFYWKQEKSRIYDTIFYFSFLFSFLVMQHIISNLLSVRQKIIIFTVLYFNGNKNFHITNKKLYIWILHNTVSIN